MCDRMCKSTWVNVAHVHLRYPQITLHKTNSPVDWLVRLLQISDVQIFLLGLCAHDLVEQSSQHAPSEAHQANAAVVPLVP